MKGATLGELEQLVLLAVLRLEQAYAISVRDEIDRRVGRKLTRGTIYVTLARLERKGYLNSWFADPTPERGGKAKKYFSLSGPAFEVLRQSQRDLLSMWEGTELADGAP